MLLLHRGRQQLKAQALALQKDLTMSFSIAAQAVQALRPSLTSSTVTAAGAIDVETEMDLHEMMPDTKVVNGPSTSVKTSGDVDTLSAETMSVLGIGLQFVSQGLKSVEPSSIRSCLLQLLPDLFRLQELAGG